jgi:1-deoxy-D-xylulose-5-phosphate reductoisomerase
MSSTRRIVIAGSTGSVGTQALDVIASSPDRFEVAAIGSGSSVAALAEQARRWHPQVVAIADESSASDLEALVPSGTEVRAGVGALASLAEVGDVVLNGVVGFAGLDVTVAALQAGKRLALANKESLVAGAPVVKSAWSASAGDLIPVDSEHCAIHQCLNTSPAAVARVVLTASGGPFRGRRLDQMADATVAEALEHPTWKMGPKITVDSSTLMNKGLEVLEAQALFDLSFEQIDVVIHPQSIVHSMVEFSDGATLAQLSNPDMRLPIGYALGYPARLAVAYGALDWARATSLEFEPPDYATFRCLGLAFAAGRAGDSAPACLNAANEVAVAAFLDGRLSWGGIADVVADTLEAHASTKLVTVQDVLAVDSESRSVARMAVERRERAA